MEMRKEQIDKMLIKLKVLESKIQNLETMTDEVLNEVESAYHDQIKVLNQKKEEAQQKLKKIQEMGD
jgi:hypothetical protein